MKSGDRKKYAERCDGRPERWEAGDGVGHLVAGRVEGGVAVPALHLDTDTLAQQVAHHLLQG